MKRTVGLTQWVHTGLRDGNEKKDRKKSQQSTNWLIELDKIDQHLRCTDWKQKNVKFGSEGGDITTEPTAFKRQWVAWRGGSAITCCSCKGLRILFPASTCLLPTGESDTLFWPLRLPLTHVVHIHTSRQNTHTHAIKINLKKTKPHNHHSKLFAGCDGVCR